MRILFHMKFIKKQEEVLRATGFMTTLRQLDINALKNQADKTKRKRIRICIHKSDEEIVQEMFIVHTKNTYIRPHKHLFKNESLHVLEGKTNILLFDELGKVKKVVQMGDFRTGLPFYMKTDKPMYHSMIITSDKLVFLEVTNGPFRKTETQFAPWSPDESDIKNVNNYLHTLTLETKKFLSQQHKKQ